MIRTTRRRARLLEPDSCLLLSQELTITNEIKKLRYTIRRSEAEPR